MSDHGAPAPIVEPDGQAMVLVPEGSFVRGRRGGDIFGRGDDRPEHPIELSAFYIDVHPVSNAQMARFVEDDGYARRELWTVDGWRWRETTGIERPRSFETPRFDAPDQPVAGASWFEADAYARWAGRRLPTEAEWERAARGTDARAFPWGARFPNQSLCNYGGHRGATTARGAYPEGVSPCGCHDMSGNVNNWCLDWYDADAYALLLAEGRTRDPALDDAETGRLRVQPRHRVDRGGGYLTPLLHWEVLSTLGRNSWTPSARELWHGFRTARPAR